MYRFSQPEMQLSMRNYMNHGSRHYTNFHNFHGVNHWYRIFSRMSLIWPMLAGCYLHCQPICLYTHLLASWSIEFREMPIVAQLAKKFLSSYGILEFTIGFSVHKWPPWVWLRLVFKCGQHNSVTSALKYVQEWVLKCSVITTMSFVAFSIQMWPP
jgi:hypothetical protein